MNPGGRSCETPVKRGRRRPVTDSLAVGPRLVRRALELRVRRRLPLSVTFCAGRCDGGGQAALGDVLDILGALPEPPSDGVQRAAHGVGLYYRQVLSCAPRYVPMQCGRLFLAELKLSQLRDTSTSRAAARSLAENTVGLELG